MAFWERSGAPSPPPVHLHNVATCHMETGITNLCLSPVAAAILSLILTLVFFFLFFFLSTSLFLVVVVFVLPVISYLTLISKDGKWRKLSLWGIGSNTHTHRDTQRQERSGMYEASGMLRGSGDHMSSQTVLTLPDRG